MAKEGMRRSLWKCVAPGKPDKYKYALYLLSSMCLGFLISFILYGWIEIRTIRLMYRQGALSHFESAKGFLQGLEYALLFSGVLSGLLAGRFFWRKIYVERIWAEKAEKFIR